MHIVPFAPEHLRVLSLQAAQTHLSPLLADGEYGQSIAESGPCFTMLDDAERVMICGGIMHLWAGRAVAWSLIGADAGRHMVRIFRAMRAFLSMQDVRRLEAVVDADFEAGHRLMAMLGWEREGLMRGYLPDGRDVVQYARVV